MLVLAMRTDNPEAELYLYEDGISLVSDVWQAHRQLSDTIHQKIASLLGSVNRTYKQIGRIIIYEGPGSFTGLRIGHSVANALAYGLGVPVIGARGDSWIHDGLKSSLDTFQPAAPFYGADAHITQPKK